MVIGAVMLLWFWLKREHVVYGVRKTPQAEVDGARLPNLSLSARHNEQSATRPIQASSARPSNTQTRTRT